MSKELNTIHQNDEIDLFELISALWEGKLWIAACCLFTTTIGSSYIFLAHPKYSVSVGYTINASLPADKKGEVVSRVINMLPSGWVKVNKLDRLSLEMLSPEAIDTYDSKLKNTSKVVSQDILAQSQSDIEIILNELPATLQSTEAVAVQILDAKKTVRTLNSGSYAIDFGTITIAQIAPKKQLVLALSVLLGGMVGVIFVLIRLAVRNRRLTD